MAKIRQIHEVREKNRQNPLHTLESGIRGAGKESNKGVRLLGLRPPEVGVTPKFSNVRH